MCFLVVTCPNLNPFPNGKLIPNNPPFRYGDELGVQCDEGYLLTNNVAALCLANGTWDKELKCNGQSQLAPCSECMYNLLIKFSKEKFYVLVHLNTLCNCACPQKMIVYCYCKE